MFFHHVSFGELVEIKVRHIYTRWHRDLILCNIVVPCNVVKRIWLSSLQEKDILGTGLKESRCTSQNVGYTSVNICNASFPGI